jgi:hypothetical protein
MALLMYGLVVRIAERAKDSTRERIAAHRMPPFRIRHGRDPLGNTRQQPQAPTRVGSWAGTDPHPLLSAFQLSNKSIRKLRASSTLGAPREVSAFESDPTQPPAGA